MSAKKRKLDKKSLSLTWGCESQNETAASPKTPVKEVMLSLDNTILGCVDLAKAEKEYWDSDKNPREQIQCRPISDFQASPLLSGYSCSGESIQRSPVRVSSHIVKTSDGALSPVLPCSSKNSPCSPGELINCEKSQAPSVPMHVCIDQNMDLDISNCNTSFWNEFLATQNESNFESDPQIGPPIAPVVDNGESHDRKEQTLHDLLQDYSVYVNVDHNITTSEEVNKTDRQNDSKMNQSKSDTYTTLLQELGVSKMDWSTDDSVLGMKSVIVSSYSPKAEQPHFGDFNQQIREKLIGNARKPVNFKKPLDVLEELPPEDDTFFGLPERVFNIIKAFKGIRDFYDWQKDCLSLPAVKNHGNLIYSLPTSGGKTLVAEVLILKELLVHKKNVIFVLPYVSIVHEKVHGLSPFALEFNFFVEEYASNKGGYPPRRHRKKNSVYVATIEKANGLINSLMSEERLSEIGLVVVDEVHLIGESRRGATLETLITKILFSQESIQIIAMSATIANVEELATFLQAVVFKRDFRPVELKEYLKCNNDVFLIEGSKSKETTFTPTRTMEKHAKPANINPNAKKKSKLEIDPDLIGQLVMEVIPEDAVLVFCRSRPNCQNVATTICQGLPRSLMSWKTLEKAALHRALVAEGNGRVCPILLQTLPYGVAYHHSGLTLAERRLLEEAFLAKTLCVICCTSTLAAGVNLPAKRVIIRAPYVGKDFINLTQYKQMIGRAGRTGLGEIGESIVICPPTDLPKLRDMLNSPMEGVISTLDDDHDGQGISGLIMSSLELKLASSLEDLHQFISKTLLSLQALKKKINVRNLTEDALQRLILQGGVAVRDPPTDVIQNEKSVFEVVLPNSEEPRKVYPSSRVFLSKIGKGAVKATLTLSTARRLYDNLKKAQENLVLATELHLIYLVTPYNLNENTKLDGQAFHTAFMALGDSDLRVAEIIGLNQATAVRAMTGAFFSEREYKNTVERFYLTLIIYDLWREVDVWDVSKKYGMLRGQVNSLMNATTAFASSVLRFTEDFKEFWCFKQLLAEMSPRLAHFCCLELQPLMELPAVKFGRAKNLYAAGYRTIPDIAKANPHDIARSVPHVPKNVAVQIVASAKLMLLAKAEILQEDAELVLEGLGVKLT